MVEKYETIDCLSTWQSKFLPHSRIIEVVQCREEAIGKERTISRNLTCRFKEDGEYDAA